MGRLRGRALLVVLACCQTAVYGQWKPQVINGQAIVHLFEWKWADIANECETFLGPKGFGGVQTSVVTENVVYNRNDAQRPWWERYQPVSYSLVTRSGDEAALKDMVDRCNAVGVRIYPDVVFNHMTGDQPSNFVGTGGASFDSSSESYPAVPYSYLDFDDSRCNTGSGGIECYNCDVEQVRNCKLVGLKDLNQSSDYVRKTIKEYLEHLIDLGVAGFRVDAVKHMWPQDVSAIFNSLKNLRSDIYGEGERAFVIQEVIDMGGEAVSRDDYTGIATVTEFLYGLKLGQAINGKNQFQYFENFGEEWGMMDRKNAVVFIDNHDNQRGGGDIITFRTPRKYKMATSFMMAWPYGFTRIMSSYNWQQNFVNGGDVNNWMGPPHDSSYNILAPTFASDGSCQGDWVCEHRWRQIYNMVEFRNVAHGTDRNDWWDNGSNQIAFCRGGNAFFALNNDNYHMKQTLQTCLPAGTYCDVISGEKENSSCTGKSVQVGTDGRGFVEILTSGYDGVLAIHLQSKL